MLPNEEEKPKITAPRRSSLKYRQQTKLDPEAIMKAKPAGKFKRNSVSWGKSNTFEFKAMKAMFTESEDINKKETEEDKEKHKKFLESRKASIKNEFSLLKDLMKKSAQAIIEEENDEETRQNMRKNLEMGKEALKEVSESSESHSSKTSKSPSKSGSKSASKSSSKSASKSSSKSASKNSSKNSSKHSSRNQSSDKKKEKKKNDKEINEENKEEKTKETKKIKIEDKDKEESEKEREKGENKGNEKIKLRKMRKVKVTDEQKEKERNKESDKESQKDKEDEEIKPKRKRMVKMAEEPKKEEKEESKEGLQEKENELNTAEKVRLITIKEANNLDIDKIAYITLTDGTVAVLKKEGQKVIELIIPQSENSNNKKNIKQSTTINNNHPNQQNVYQMKQNNIPQEEIYYQDNIYENQNIPQLKQNYISNITKSNYSLYNINDTANDINQENIHYKNFNNLYNAQNLPKTQIYECSTEPKRLRYFNNNIMPQSRYSYQIQNQSQPNPQFQNLQTQYPQSLKFKRIINTPPNYQQYRNSLDIDYSQIPNSSPYRYKIIEAVPANLCDNCNSIIHKSMNYLYPLNNQKILFSNNNSQRINTSSYQRRPYYNYLNRKLNNYSYNKVNSSIQKNNIYNRLKIDSFNDFDQLEVEPYNYRNDELYRNPEQKYNEISIDQGEGRLKRNNLRQRYLYALGRQVNDPNNSYTSRDIRYSKIQGQRYNNQNYN